MLREIRLSHGLRLQELANEAKLSRFTVENAEKGNVISQASASRIVSAMIKLTGQTYTVENLGIQTKQKDT